MVSGRLVNKNSVEPVAYTGYDNYTTINRYESRGENK